MEKENYFETGFIGSTRAELQHQVGNKIIPLLELGGDDLQTTSTENKFSFVAGLQKAIDEQYSVEGELTYTDLNNLINLAKNMDWLDRVQLQRLKDACINLIDTK